VHRASSQESQWPFPAQHDDTEDEVDDLQHGERLDRSVEVLCQEVPEDLGPEKALDCGRYLICGLSVNVNDGREAGLTDGGRYHY
jgi:hypothetical protein